tara:strand:+ start:92 stop:490 length:399 start_codon:yes stop_codon:yes gene_type:complete
MTVEDNKKGAIEFDQTTLTPFSDASKEGDMVDMIRKIMSGQPDTNGSEPQSSDTTVVKKVEAVLKAEGESDDDVEPTKTSDKLDGRTRDYRSTVSRITDGKKKKSGEGIDGRTKSYKTTMSRINTRRARKRG